MIVIPMAGLSSRFFQAGYDVPKYMLEANGKTLFEYTVESFSEYFLTDIFLFILRNDEASIKFVHIMCRRLGIKSFSVVILDSETRGQAETVYLGLMKYGLTQSLLDEPLYIFNIDTIRPNFIKPHFKGPCDGYLEVFKGNGENWSFAKPEKANDDLVIETAEKRPISDLCSTGMYYFKNCEIFLSAYMYYEEKSISEWDSGELYVAPIYNYLISRSYKIRYYLIDTSEVIFCGIPDEYESFKRKKLYE